MSVERRSRRLNAVGMIAVVVVGLTWLLASNGLFGPVDYSDPRGPDPRLKDKQRPVEIVPVASEAPEPLGAIGVGSLKGRVVESPGGPAVAGADLYLLWRANGVERVDRHAKTEADGSFDLGDVPAGVHYALKIETRRKAVRNLGGIVVRAGQATDLGAVSLEAPEPAPATPR